MIEKRPAEAGQASEEDVMKMATAAALPRVLKTDWAGL